MLMQQQPANARSDRFVRALVRHWIWLVNGFLALYAGLPWLSPLLRSVGWERTGQAMFRMYAQFCHQLPERSFTFNGFPVCYCHRCTALYTTLLGMSFLYTVGRWQQTIGKHLLLLFTLPMIVDGGWHLLDDLLPTLGLRAGSHEVGSLNFWLRMVTGTLFGIGVVLWAYPRIQREFDRV